jgi:hypothetical protein
LTFTKNWPRDAAKTRRRGRLRYVAQAVPAASSRGVPAPCSWSPELVAGVKMRPMFGSQITEDDPFVRALFPTS